MSQFYVPDPEQMVICPYDEVHVVSHKRMQYHLVKCRKNHDTSEKATCPFNRRHEVPKLELRYHMMICTDKVFLESEFYETADSDFRGNLSTPPFEVEQFIVKPSELWESESHVLSELKQDELKEFRNLTGLKPVERRQYKLKLKEKFEKEQNGERDDSAEDKHEAEKIASGLQPLRRPTTVSVAEQMQPSIPLIGRGRGCFPYDVIKTLNNSVSGQVGKSSPNGFTPEKSVTSLGRGVGIGRGSSSFLSNRPSAPINFQKSDYVNPDVDYNINPNFKNRQPLAPGQVADIDLQEGDVLEEFCNLNMN